MYLHFNCTQSTELNLIVIEANLRVFFNVHNHTEEIDLIFIPNLVVAELTVWTWWTSVEGKKCKHRVYITETAIRQYVWVVGVRQTAAGLSPVEVRTYLQVETT